MRTSLFTIPWIPDCTEHRLTAVYESDVRIEVFEAALRMLRMLGRVPPGEVTVILRARFDPAASEPQARLALEVEVQTGPGLSVATVQALTNGGPLSAFYEFVPTEAEDRPALTERWDVVRAQEELAPWVPVDLNPYIPASYEVARPFVANEENDGLALDRMLANVTEPVLVELQVSPAQAAPYREFLFERISRLLAINAFDATYVPGIDDAFDGDELDDEPLRPIDSHKVRDPLADEVLREQQELFQNFRRPLYGFALFARAKTQETARSVATTLAEASFLEGVYDLRTAPDHPDRSVCNLAQVATAEELAGAFRLPVASATAPRCMRRTTDPPERRQHTEPAITLGYDLESGAQPPTNGDPERHRAPSRSNVPLLRLPLDLLKKHLFVAGVPGSGKTTAVINLLVQLHRVGIPFLILEPAKTEYRVLKLLHKHSDARVRALAQAFRVYTPGNERIAPLRLNPMEYDETTTTRDEHIGQLMAVLKASIPLWGPLEAILADAIEESYYRTRRTFPVMSDVVSAAREISHAKGYAGEVQSNIEAAISVRLEHLTRRSIGKLFRAERCEPPLEELISSPTVIELEHLDAQTSAFFVLLLLSRIRTHLRDARPSGSPLQHVIVIEEAHNIVGRSTAPAASDDAVDTRTSAAQFVSRMLAELRALGEGLIIADQLPSTVAPEVVKNTGVKLAGRLVSKDDREDLGSAMLLDPVQTEELARLRPGEAYVYHERLYRPRRLRALNASAYLGLATMVHPTSLAIVPALEGDAWFQQLLKIQLDGVLDYCDQLLTRLEHTSPPESADDLDTVATLFAERDSLDRAAHTLATEYLQPIQERFERHATSELQAQLASLKQLVHERLIPGLDQARESLDRQISRATQRLEAPSLEKAE